jgi:hypothetical protein
MEPGEITVKLVAGVPPKLTPVTPVKLLPLIVIVAPPVVFVVPGETELTDGSPFGTANVYRSPELRLELPIEVTTVISTVPDACAGVTAVICDDEFTEYDAAIEFPNSTAVTLLNPAPLIVMGTPPWVDPF